MIVISGALVLVALVLLIIGLSTQELGFVYASIGVSLVSFAFLVIGILQRRGEQPATGDAEAAPAAQRPSGADAPEGVTAVIPAPQADDAPPLDEDEVEQVLADDELVEEEEAVGGTVLVVAGRPRYHVDGCRYLSGKAAEEVHVLDAREDGFSPCGVCRPDEALEEAEAEVDVADEVVDEPAPARRGGTSGSAALSSTAPAAKASGRGGARKATPPAAQAAAPPAKRAAKTASRRAVAATAELPAEEVLADEAAAEPAPVEPAAPAAPAKRTGTRRPAKKAAAPAAAPAADTVEIAETVEIAPVVPVRTGRTAAKAPAKRAPAKSAPATAAPATSAAPKRGGVVVIPDRGKFHTADCRYVRGAADAETITRAQASKQGYEACGVCKP